ncbi:MULTISPECIES: hypothetical protein [Mycobacterium]|uniref:Uncharacterized protein n=1 Tax=Mycobacterium paragordonae TaxID=1389713 RepID=A0ABQ1CFE4_9MYCO|nr:MULTISPECIES: hypothetical protein [Mycobacterium]QNI15264.1 hypothetical protein GAN18_29225 [Mycobacterium kubicae]GFG83159.1 hypothetical protein MPRG_64350 [Mycobacterium paragordonae]
MSGQPRGRAVDITAHLPVLLIGLQWLLDTEQPETALVSRHGQVLRSVGNRVMRFLPLGFDGRAAVFLYVERPEWSVERKPRHLLARNEINDLADLVTDCGEQVEARWLCDPRVSCAVALRTPVHPSLLAAVERFEAGCPKRAHRGALVCRCQERHAGFASAVSVHDLTRRWRIDPRGHDPFGPTLRSRHDGAGAGENALERRALLGRLTLAQVCGVIPPIDGDAVVADAQLARRGIAGSDRANDAGDSGVARLRCRSDAIGLCDGLC